jgi:dipeptidase D
MSVRELEPKIVWNHFEDLNAIPRPSKKEERVIAFMKNFGENLGFPTYVDPCGNVIIKKPASKGMEDRQTVILQSHLDMVHQKNSDTVFDFDTQGIQTWIDGEWVKAKGTTLGADNGMGVAAIMSLLISTDIAHPAIEALFTIDEETGMTGAFELEKGILDGTILLNLDTEDDDEFSIGCAGGIDTNTILEYTEVTPEAKMGFQIVVKGLKGGHSGMDIILERGNANKIMNRLLSVASDNCNLGLAKIDGGSLRNAIPRESLAEISVNPCFEAKFETRKKEILEEFKTIEPDMEISIESIDVPVKVMDNETSMKVVAAVQSCFNGVFRMSPSIKGLVEASSSLARVKLNDGKFITQSLQRSSVDSSKEDVSKTVGNVFKLIGCNVEYDGSYPGWEPNANSPILTIMKGLYKEQFNEEPIVAACHAGLECGILGERYPGLDMISFGPTIKNPHSPDEKVNIASVQKFWGFLTEVLKNIPKK